MKLTPRPGETWLRITPPIGGQPGYSQAGTVEQVTDTTVELLVRCDVMRSMNFELDTGFDVAGLGSFLVKSEVVTP